MDLSTDPSAAPQDTTLQVRVLGSGFEPGANAAFLREGAPAPGIVTAATSFVSDSVLVADVTVALDAEVALYDVEVTSRNGRRRGVGQELFSVTQKTTGGPPDPESMSVAIPGEVRSGTVNALAPDGVGPYANGACGVQATYYGAEFPSSDFFAFRPLDNGLSKKAQRDLARACPGAFPRRASLDLAAATVHLGGGATGHDADMALPDYIAAGGADPFAAGDTDLVSARSGGFELLQAGASLLRGGSFNLEYCLDDGRGSPFRFNRDSAPGSSDLDVSRAGSVFTVRTQAYPNNLGACEHGRSDGSTVSLLLHLDVAYTVESGPPS